MDQQLTDGMPGVGDTCEYCGVTLTQIDIDAIREQEFHCYEEEAYIESVIEESL